MWLSKSRGCRTAFREGGRGGGRGGSVAGGGYWEGDRGRFSRRGGGGGVEC